MKVAIVTLGCDKNTVDNEYLAGMLERAGCEVVAGAAGDRLDAAVVTTCGFIESAKQQSIDAIAQLVESKRATGFPARVFVAGCLAQRYASELGEQLPGIDGIVGVGQFRDLTRMIAGDAEIGGAPRINVAPRPTVDIYEHLYRKPFARASHAFLKLSDGCNHGCSFCSIPLMKGKLRSVEPGILLDEARALLARGVREICLVAQDLSDYGRDWPSDRSRVYGLPEFIRELCALEGEFWVRCLYYYPGNVTDRFLEVLATEKKVVPYLEMPLQHLEPGMLRRMRRPFHERSTFELIERIRESVPGIAMRTTFIVGFPGETQDAFQYLLDGARRIEFDRMGVFEYSREDGTPAAEMDEQVADATKRMRWRMLMDRQSKISERLNRRRKGRVERVLVERFDDESGRWIARSTADAPNVDACVYIEPDVAIRAGDFTTVKIEKTDTYDAKAKIWEGVA